MQETSNYDIMLKLTELQGTLSNVVAQQNISAKVQEDHEKRIQTVEKFVIAYEAAAKALEGSAIKGGVGGINKDFVNIILKFIGVITALIGVLYLAIQAMVK